MPDRMLHESLLVSEKMASLTDFEFRLWTGLVLLADNAGRGDARAAIIKGRAFALCESVRTTDIAPALERLGEKGCISLYSVSGRRYYRFPNWAKHQRLRDTKPKYPPPDGTEDERESAADRGGLPPEEKRSEYKEEAENRGDIEGESVHTHGKYGWVRLSCGQYESLVRELGAQETQRCIDYVDESAQSTGNRNRWRDWELTVRKCHRDRWGLDRGKSAVSREPSYRVDLEQLQRNLNAI